MSDDETRAILRECIEAHKANPPMPEECSHRTLCATCGKVLVENPFDLCLTCAEKEWHARRAENVDERQRRLFG